MACKFLSICRLSGRCFFIFALALGIVFVSGDSFALSGTSPSRPHDNIIIPLVKYYVIADNKTATFLKEYCDKTEMKYEIIPDGRIKAGPFLSGYEANWLTGLTAHARTIEEDDFTAANIDNVDSLKLIYSDSGKISGKTWALLTPYFKHKIIKAIVPDIEQPAFYLLSQGYLLEIAIRPWVDFYQDSFGLAFVDSPSSPIFIQVIGGGRGTGCKSEICRIWHFDIDERVKIPLYEFEASDFLGLEEDVTFTCSRLSADKNTLIVQYYHLTGNIKHARGDGSIKGGTDKSDANINILENVEIEKGEYKTYPTGQAAIKEKIKNYKKIMSILPPTVQSALHNKALSSSVSSPDILKTINNYWTVVRNCPVTIEKSQLDNLILEFCQKNNCQNNVQIRRALLKNIKKRKYLSDDYDDFINFDEFISLLFKVSKIPGGTINISDLNVSFIYRTDSRGTYRGLFNWKKDRELIQDIFYHWWDTYWTIDISEGERQKRIDKFSKRYELPKLNEDVYLIDAKQGRFCGVTLNQTYSKVQQAFPYKMMKYDWEAHCKKIGFILEPLNGLKLFFNKDNFLAEIEVSSSQFQTSEGIKCEDTKEKLIKTYGKPNEIVDYKSDEEYLYNFNGAMMAFTLDKKRKTIIIISILRRHARLDE
jgi:hypothetical protein